MLYFWIITCMKRAIVFLNSKSSASGCCLAFAWLFAHLSLVLLIKVLLNIIRKFIYVWQERFKTKNGALRNTSIYWIFLEGVPSRTTWSRLLLRKDKVRPKNWSKDPWDLSLKRRIACQTLTKALNISIFTAVVVPDLLVPSDATLERPAVDWQELKPK